MPLPLRPMLVYAFLYLYTLSCVCSSAQAQSRQCSYGFSAHAILQRHIDNERLLKRLHMSTRNMCRSL